MKWMSQQGKTNALADGIFNVRSVKVITNFHILFDTSAWPALCPVEVHNSGFIALPVVLVGMFQRIRRRHDSKIVSKIVSKIGSQ